MKHILHFPLIMPPLSPVPRDANARSAESRDRGVPAQARCDEWKVTLWQGAVLSVQDSIDCE
jgi:hypothetical protein